MLHGNVSLQLHAKFHGRMRCRFPVNYFFSLGVHTWTLWDPKGLSPLAPCKISWPYKVLFPHELIFSLGVHIWTPWDPKG